MGKMHIDILKKKYCTPDDPRQILNEGIFNFVHVVRRLAGTVHPQNKTDCTLVTSSARSATLEDIS